MSKDAKKAKKVGKVTSTPKLAKVAKKKTSSRKKTASARRQEGKKKYTRKTADKHELYQLSVQDPDFELAFIDKTFKRAVGRRAISLREDFCGTALFCGAWVKSRAERTALGIDLDQSVMDWGIERNLKCINEPGDRVQLLCQDVREAVPAKSDLCVAFNFSYWCFQDRRTLRDYFESVRKGLVKDGMFFLDAYGGHESHEPDLEEPREVEAGFTYVWHQDKVDPINNRVVNHIHFGFKDKTTWRKAFTYEWRFWSLPEIRELLEESGFSDVVIHWDVADADDTSVYRPRKTAHNDPGWIAYISARA